MVVSNSENQDSSDYSIGTRISSNGGHGTIVYVGEVAPHEGEWLGIDWDDPTRGKHDGSYKNVRYFNASHPTSGSFVRPNKVQFGCAFMESVREKYAPGQLDDFDVIHVSDSKTIEFVGMQKISTKQSQLHRLRSVILDNSPVNRADHDLSMIANSLPNVIELHMCQTLLSDWTQVERICRQMPSLTYLNLSLNVFKPLDTTAAKIVEPLSNIRSLILTECRMEWDEVNALSALFPNITELGLCRNRIASIGSINFRNLRSLDLESNPKLGTYLDFNVLAALPSLELLNLSNTNWTDFEFPAKTQVVFPSLKFLYFSNNRIKKWRTINELNKFPALEHLIIHGNPVLANESSDTARQLVIAKIKRLKILERQEIIAQERRGAEIDYLRTCGRQRKEMDKDEFAREHPRFDELCKSCGAPEDWEMRITQTGVLKNGILDLHIEVAGRDPVVKKIPGTMTVQKLKALIGRMFSIDVRRIQLAYESEARPGIIIPLENDFRDLVFYSLESGNRVLVTT